MAEEFVRQAALEGFIHSNGSSPTPCNVGYVYTIHKDMTIAHLSLCVWVTSFQHNCINEIPSRIDYRKYIEGEKDYKCHNPHMKKRNE